MCQSHPVTITATSRFSNLVASPPAVSAAEKKGDLLPEKPRLGFFSEPSGRSTWECVVTLKFASGCEGYGYESAMGRGEWLSRDPIAEKGGLNLYGYVGGNPINDLDPLGLVNYRQVAIGGIRVIGSMAGAVALTGAEVGSLGWGTPLVAAGAVGVSLNLMKGMAEIGQGLQDDPCDKATNDFINNFPGGVGELAGLPFGETGRDIGRSTDMLIGIFSTNPDSGWKFPVEFGGSILSGYEPIIADPNSAF
jgi:hypothetical protein